MHYHAECNALTRLIERCY